MQAYYGILVTQSQRRKNNLNLKFDKLTKDQRESVWLIAILSFLALNCMVGAFLIPINFFIIALLLFLVGIFLLAVAVTGYFVEFRGWDPKD